MHLLRFQRRLLMIDTLTIILYISLVCFTLFVGLSIYYFFKYDVINIYKELTVHNKEKSIRKIYPELNKLEEASSSKKGKPIENVTTLMTIDKTTLMNDPKDINTSLMATNSSFVIESIEIITELNKIERSKIQ